MNAPACIECGTPIGRVEARVNPKTIDYDLVAQCGHTITREIGSDLWRSGWRWAIPLISGDTLGEAERARQIAEEGHTPDHDAGHTEGLAWAAWAYVDRAMNPSESKEPPPSWPWEAEAWNASATPLRHLVIADALLRAEIDRRLVEAQRNRSNP